jgi:hypothetical protein
MKGFLVVARQLAVLVGAAAIGAFGFEGDAPAPTVASPMPTIASHIKHAPVHAHRNEDGSLARAENLAIATGNWAGYASANFETHQVYNAAAATWTVPTVTFEAGAASGDVPQFSSEWVGIGGFCTNPECTAGDSSLIQVGTTQAVASDGTTLYYSWYEALPNFPVNMPNPVSPGDVITASLLCTASCSSKKLQLWTLKMSSSAGWEWSVPVPYNSSKLSAEWIEEAPSFGGILPLADFNTVTIDPDLGGEGTPQLTLATNGIVMVNPWGQIAIPSEPRSGSFDVCWSSGAIAPCPSP